MSKLKINKYIVVDNFQNVCENISVNLDITRKALSR